MLIPTLQLALQPFGRVTSEVKPMRIAFDGDRGRPEIEVRGNASELVEFGQQLVAGVRELTVSGQEGGTEFYPEPLTQLRCVEDEAVPKPSLIDISLDGNALLISGGAVGLRKLGQSCVNVFTKAAAGEHMHLEYFEGNQLMAETPCSVIFVAEG